MAPPPEEVAVESISSYGVARSTVAGEPLNAEDLRKIDAYFRASMYLCLGMLYLRENPLLKQPLTKEHLKARLLGHWGSDAGQAFTWMHFNRLIKKYELDALFISGPGHGAPAILSQSYMEGVYSEVYPDKSEDEDGMKRFFKQFSFPGGIGSHATPETPGSIHEGGELGYSISHAFGSVFDHPNLISLTMVGDGEAETGPLATSWHTRISHTELEALFIGYGWTPYFVEGSDMPSMHQAMAATLENYRPEELFDKQGKLIPELKELAPVGNARMSANPVGNDFRKYALADIVPGVSNLPSMSNMAGFLRDIVAKNMTNFRVFGPDETESNKLGKVYEAGKKVWMGEYFEEDTDGGNLAMEGRVMEMLSEHTCEGWMEGYILSGRHGILNSYEPFIHVIDSMVNQHCKWIEKCLEVPWRVQTASLNILLTATVWRQDHNGFTHQDPGFLDVVANKSPEVVRIYLPPDGNCLLSVTAHCLSSVNYVNVIVADKQDHLQFLGMDEAIEHCTKGLGIWNWASNDQGEDPDVVMATCGDVPTHESLAATALLRELVPSLKVRFVNVVDLFKLIDHEDHPHGITDREWTAIFTDNRPVIFNFHSYPWLIHRLTYKRPGQKNIHVRGYKEKGNIDTPLELAIRNQTDRFTKIEAFENGIDPENIRKWVWPYSKTA
ncbi:putative phosphoketolase [Glarea lozoyensis 74030]|uniref:Putative phosphoketolase n=1 Tax=Glarea lozoyensis (strain ATCC 74030 / MF5533) TaxID=1104152 RepID=H0EZ33_GLAL7|nr:putative phosphoketolase [Glarea lozoyensis 74030]